MATGKPKNNAIRIFLWILLYISIIDAGINLILAYPSDPRNVNPSYLQTYFEYGRSSEGKLRRMTGRSGDESAPIVAHGWMTSENYASLPNKPLKKDQVLVSVYGMSHTGELAGAISKLNKNLIIRQIIAPGAPPNWTYSMYQFDKSRHQPDVVILGIMTDSVPFISSTSGATTYFDMSYPYTFPRFVMGKDKLLPLFPPFISADG